MMGVAGDSHMLRLLPAHIYHSDRDAISCSLLKPLLISPAHFQAGLVGVERSSDAKDLGTLVHLLLLQPHLASAELAVFPGIPDKRGEFDEFAAQFPDRLVVDEPTLATAQLMASKLAEARFKGRPLRDYLEEAIPEATIYFTEPTTGLQMRIRIDCHHPEFTFDVKTSRFAEPRSFLRDAVDKHYDLQAYMYSLGRCLYEGSSTPKPFVFAKVENAAPFSVGMLTAGENFMGNGAKKFQACVATYQACMQTGYWPDLGAEDVLEIEPWQQFGGTLTWQSALATMAAPALP